MLTSERSFPVLGSKFTKAPDAGTAFLGRTGSVLGEEMMTVPARVEKFIQDHGSEAYCDSCIQGRLGLARAQQVQQVTSSLAITAAFERRQGMCAGCQQKKMVIRAR